MTHFCLRHKKLTILFWSLLISGFLFVIVARLLSDQPAIDNSSSIWFLSDDQELAAYQQYNHDFGEKEWTILQIKTQSIYEPGFLEDLKGISQRLESLDHIVKVTSIANVRDNELDQDEALNYTEILPRKAFADFSFRDEQINAFKQKLFSNPLFEKNLFQRQDPRHTVILIQNDNLLNNASPYRIELVDAINDILQGYPSIQDYALAGTTIINAELNRSALRDVFVFYTLVTLLLVLFGWLTLNSFKDLLVMLVVVFCSMLSAMGLLAMLQIPYNMVTVMMPTILISLSVAGVIHIINEFHRIRRNKEAEEAIRETIRLLWKPHISTALTTIIGFASLSLSSVMPIFQLGLFSGFGIFIGWLASVTIAPVLLVLLWQINRKSANSRTALLDKAVDALAAFAPKFPYQKIFILVLASLPAGGVFLLKTDTNYTKFFGSSADLTQAYEAINKAGNAQNPVSIILRFPQHKTWSDQANFKHIVDFENALVQLPQVIKLMSAAKLVEQIDLAFNTANTSKVQFRSYNQNQINQLLLLGELSNNDDINDFLLRNKSQTQILALTPYMSSRELDRFKQAVFDLHARHFPEPVEIVITGSTVLWANMDTQVSHTQFVSLIGISSFLVIFLISLFRSLKLGLIGILVNALPLAITFGIMGWLDIKINMATAVIGGLSLGIVVDDTIHFINAFHSLIKQGVGVEAAVQKTMKTVGKSILMTTIILIGGFSCMATSEFLPSAHFGIFISMAIALALLLDIFLLPAILVLARPGVKYRQQTLSPIKQAHSK